jgi:hypothetical protein
MLVIQTCIAQSRITQCNINAIAQYNIAQLYFENTFEYSIVVVHEICNITEKQLNVPYVVHSKMPVIANDQITINFIAKFFYFLHL